MAKPGLNMELNRLVQDQPPGQEGPRPGPPNPALHLPNVPSYRPAITRIPVLVSRRTALSNSNFTKEIRSSIRRLGSVILPPACLGCGLVEFLHGLGCLPTFVPCYRDMLCACGRLYRPLFYFVVT